MHSDFNFYLKIENKNKKLSQVYLILKALPEYSDYAANNI